MLKFHELAPSPNSIKVRLALRFKGIDFEVDPVNPVDRAPIVAVSGQELTPVIEDKGIVLHDSEAILHFLDANYRDTPSLYPAERAGRKACDAWRAMVYETVVPASGALFLSAIGLREDPGEEGRLAFREACAWTQEQLGDDGLRDYPYPVCEIWLASWLNYAFPSEGQIARVPLFAKGREVYGVEPGSYPKLESWLAPWTARLG